MRKKQSSSFIATPPGLSRPGKSPWAGGSNTNVVKGPSRNKGNKGSNFVDKAVAVYEGLPPEGQALINTGASAVGKAALNQARKQGAKIMNRKGSGEGNAVSKSNNPHSHSSGYGLSRAPIPAPISLDTGLQPNTYVNDYMEASWNLCVPLSITACKFTFPTATANALYTYFTNIIAFTLQTNAQRNVTFNINLTNFSAANILSAMNALVDALQIYFYYSSILTYHSDPANHNMGMIYLRNQLTAQFIEDLELLERRLLDTPIPPRLLEYLRYLSGTFYSGDAAGSPLIKMVPFAPSATMTDLTAPATALAALATSTNNDVFTVMRKAVPQWRPAKLYDVPPTPFYDANFKTIFANLPSVSYYNTTVNYLPTVASQSTSIVYNSYSNVLDGGAFALTGAYSSTDATWYPGLLIPVSNTSGTTTNKNTRWSYYPTSSSNTSFTFTPSDANQVLIKSRQETISVADTYASTYSIHLSGAQLLQNVNANSIRETTYKLLDYLMSLDLIRTDARSFLMNSISGGKS